MTYWERRQRELNQALEKDEAKLKKRLSSFYDAEYRKLEKEIARLEKLAWAEKQPKKKFELVQKINSLKGVLMSI